MSDAEKITIRPVAATDLGQLVCLIQYFAACHGEVSLASTDSLKRDLFGWSPCIRGFVAARGPLLIGYALYFPVYNAQRAERGMDLSQLFVLEEERGRGVGLSLISAVRKQAYSAGGAFVTVATHQGNTAARTFYEKHFGDGLVGGPTFCLAV